MESNTVKPIGVDASGYEVLTNAVHDLLNAFPGLYEDEEISFEDLEETSGIAFSADSGALVMSERITITGKVMQNCQYPFFIVYRTSGDRESRKLRLQEFMDSLGKWICREPAIVNGESIRLSSFPPLADGRKIERITRMNSYGLEPKEDGTQDWLLPCTVEYTNEYYR